MSDCQMHFSYGAGIYLEYILVHYSLPGGDFRSITAHIFTRLPRKIFLELGYSFYK